MPRLTNFSSINATIDNIHIQNINTKNYIFPYSLVVANTESLPEEGECFTTMTYIPYDFQVQSITLQINQNFDKTSKVNIKIKNKNYEFTMETTKPTLNKQCNFTLQKDSFESIEIENMKDDDGDVSCCTVILNGKVKH